MVIYADRMPQIGETLSGSDFAINGGGKGANQAVAVANVDDEIKHHGIVKNDVVDTTAAGDSFLGGFVVSLARGASTEEAVEFATYTSSLTVGREGAGKSIPTYDEVIDYMMKVAL